VASRFKIFSRCEGATAVEFAILLPVVMLILAGLIDFGWGFYWKHTVTNASRAGARYGVQANYPSGVRTPYDVTAITNLVTTNYGAGLTVAVDPVAGPVAGAFRSVTVTKTMEYFMVGILQSWGVPVPTTISNKTTMTME